MTLDIRAALESLRSAEESTRREVVERLGRSQTSEAVPALLLAVADESWPVRQAAIKHLTGFELAILLGPLEAALRNDEDAALRNAAMEIFVELGAAAVAVLLRLLRDANEEIRNFAAVILGAIGDSRAIEPLVATLKDADVNVRHSAATSLGQLRATEALAPLIEALTGEPWLQYPAINALAEIGDAGAVPALLRLLEDPLLRGPVMDALGRLAGREALPQLMPHLHDPDPVVRNMAIRAVVAIEQRATASGESLDPEVQAALRREDLVDHLLESLSDDDPLNRRTAAITLGWLKEPRAERPLIDLLAEAPLQGYVTHALVSIGFRDPAAYAYGLAHPDDSVRQGTLRCLAWIAPPSGTDLAAPMIHDPSAEVRAEAVSAIGRLGHEDAAMLLFELLGDEHELIQESAMRALTQLSREQTVPLLHQALGNADDEVRIHAAETLGLLGDRDSAPALIRLYDDSREGVRRAAIKALGEIEAPGVPELLRSAVSDESSLVRQQAVLSLGKLEDLATADDLLPLLEDPDPKMRFVALRALGQIRNPGVVAQLMPFLSDARKELRFAAVAALGSIRAPSAVSPLMDVLGDPDRNLRRATAESLGAIGDPQAVAPLLVALEDEHWSVRCAAATALGRIRSSRATPGLLDRLNDADATVKRAALAALGEVGDPRAASRLAECLDDPGLQATALEALRHMGVAALPEIERLYPQLSVPARCLLVDLAGRLEDRRALTLLLSALSDEAASVRVEAALALGEGGFLDALRPLMEAKSQDPATEVRRAAAIALKKLAPR